MWLALGTTRNILESGVRKRRGAQPGAEHRLISPGLNPSLNPALSGLL